MNVLCTFSFGLVSTGKNRCGGRFFNPSDKLPIQGKCAEYIQPLMSLFCERFDTSIPLFLLFNQITIFCYE